MIRTLVLAAALAVGATAVVAQSDPIAQRKALMKEVGGAMGPLAAMNKGEAPFDLAKVKASLDVFGKSSKSMGALFPATSKTGGETAADPKIWDDAAGWAAAIKKYDDVTVAAVAAIKDEASFKAEFPKLGGACGGCHNTYRVKK